MSASDWGLTFETHSGDRWDLDDVAHNGGSDRLVDGYTTRRVAPRTTGPALRPELHYEPDIPAGAKVGCKVCRRQIRDGSTTRRGRWYVSREELAVVDAVALGVYHEDGGIIGSATALLPVASFERLLGDWSDAAHPDFEQVTRPSWATVFDPEVVDRG